MNNATMKPCQQWAEKLAMVHPDDLSLSEREELEAHLTTCSACTAVRAQYNDITALLDDLPVDGVPADLPPRLMQLWEQETKPRELPIPAWRVGARRHVGTPLVGVRPSSSIFVWPARRHVGTPLVGVRPLLVKLMAAVLIVGVFLGFVVTHLPGGNQPVTSTSIGGPSFGAPALIIANPPVFWQSNVYISTGKVVAAYRSNNGSLIRTYGIGNGQDSRVKSLEPVIVNGVMYVIGTTYPDPGSSGIDGIYALRLSDGAILWHTIVGDTKILPLTIADAIAVDDGIVYATINAHSQYLYALRASDGVLLWKFKAGQPYEADISLPVVAHGVAYAGVMLDTKNATVVALNTSNGKLLWQRKVAGEQFVAPTIADGVLYAGSQGVVSALRISDGSPLWQFDIGGSFTSPNQPIVVNGIDYIVADNGYIYALRENNGAQLWDYKLSDSSTSISDPILANGLIYVGIFTGFGSSHGSYVDALSLKDGHIVWQYKLAANVIPALAYGNGAIYFEILPKYPDQLYALRAGNGAVLWHTDIPL